MKITTIVEDTVYGSELFAEHGVSMLIEVDKQKILFDTGQSGEVLLRNAATMGIDLSQVDKLVLSHGHYDHTGGLRSLGKIIDSVDTFAHPDIFQNKWSKRQNQGRYIGIPFSKQAVSGWGFNLHLSKEPMMISESVIVTGEIPRVTDFESVDNNLCLREGDVFVQDQIYDDLSLIVRSEKGLILILGCAHSGLVNILKYLFQLRDRWLMPQLQDKQSTNLQNVPPTPQLQAKQPEPKLPVRQPEAKLPVKHKTQKSQDNSLQLQTKDEGQLVLLTQQNLAPYKKNYNDDNLHLVIGGTHLVGANKDRIQKTIKALKDFNAENVAVSHCTGEKAVIMLYQAFGDDMVSNHVGNVIEINPN